MIGMIAYAILGGFILIAVFISNRLVKIFGWSLSPNKLFLLPNKIIFFSHPLYIHPIRCNFFAITLR